MRRGSSSRAFFAGALAFLLATAGAPEGEAQAPLRVKLATYIPRGSSYHQILLAMGEKWRQAPGGGVALTIYPDGTVGSEADIVRKMRVGQIHAGLLSVTGLSEMDDSVTALQTMPMMFRSLDEVDYVRQALQPLLERRLLDKGFLMLSWSDAGWVRFFSKEPVFHPADVKKMKLFVTAGDNDQIDILKGMGYDPRPLEWSDVLPGLQTGLINALFFLPFAALSGQIYGTAPHMLEINFAPLVGGTVITKKMWDTIPAADQEELLRAAREAGEQIKTRGRVENEEAVEAMKKRGLIVHPVTPEIEAEWRKVAEEVYPKIRGSMVPADMFDEVQRLLKEYRASQGKPKT